MAKSGFKLSDECELQIADRYIHIQHSGGMSSIVWDGNFTLKQLGETILTDWKKNPNKDWSKVGNISITVEIVDEGNANLCIGCGIGSFWLMMKQEAVPALAKFFIDNN